MAETTKNAFKIYTTKEGDASYNVMHEGFCERFENSINKNGVSVCLYLAYNAADTTMETIIKTMIANNAIVGKIEIFGADTTPIFTTTEISTDYNYSVMNTATASSFDVTEVLVFNM